MDVSLFTDGPAHSDVKLCVCIEPGTPRWFFWLKGSSEVLSARQSDISRVLVLRDATRVIEEGLDVGAYILKHPERVHMMLREDRHADPFNTCVSSHDVTPPDVDIDWPIDEGLPQAAGGGNLPEQTYMWGPARAIDAMDGYFKTETREQYLARREPPAPPAGPHPSAACFDQDWRDDHRSAMVVAHDEAAKHERQR
jgi:hypothetical protein